jgi:6-phosphofructokinase
MIKKIAIVTAGGHISGYHQAMLSISETLEDEAPGEFELVGANFGFKGLEKRKYIPVRREDIDVDRAGSLTGSDRKIADLGKVIDSVRKNGIYAIIVMGGDNHLGEAAKMAKEGINVVGFSRTMDGDLSSGVTIGYESAVAVGAQRTREHHNTAMTYSRVFYVPIFGRNTDWTVVGVTAYGGGDRGLPCEQEYSWNELWGKIDDSLDSNEERYGVRFAVVVSSEGVKIKEMKGIPREHTFNDAHKQEKLRPEWVGMELERLTKESGMDACFQAHTYDMRDAPPTETEKHLSGMGGKECARMVLDGDFGKAIVFAPDGAFYKVGRAPLEEVKVQRALKPEGYFDYKELRPTQKFIDDYGRLFHTTLGDAPIKDELVYRNMLHRRR